jgi:hypothetical protein
MILNPSVITDIKSIINSARDRAIRAVDTERVLMYWHIGQRIFLEEQNGKDRADYGKFLVKHIAESLEPEYGTGFSIRHLEMCRQFYRVFPIANTLCSQLSWSHYRLVLRIDNQNNRNFYIAETVKNNWSVRQLERQINSNLFERLLMSKDQDSVLAVANKEQQPTDAKQIITITINNQILL